jgi:hypothetical protein
MQGAVTKRLVSQQALIGAQIAVSVPIQIWFAYYGFHHFGLGGPAGSSFSDGLAYAAQWHLMAGLVLLAMIMFIAGFRPLSLRIIDGNDRDDLVAVHVRVQRNTLEQLVLLIVGDVALLTVIPPESAHIIGVHVLLFIGARAVYWIGYAIDPLYRTVGFVATFYPNIAVMLYAAYRIAVTS